MARKRHIPTPAPHQRPKVRRAKPNQPRVSSKPADWEAQEATKGLDAQRRLKAEFLARQGA